MARWQRHARVLLGLFAVAFAVMLWFVVGKRQPPAPVPAIERLDPKAVSEVRGGDVLQHKGEKRDIRVEFGSQIGYTDGRTKFTSFRAFIDDRGGRSFVVSGNEAFVGPSLSSYDVRGNVRLETSDGLTATTPEATFTEAEGILRGGGPVQFQRGRTTGSSVGFAYDRTLDRLWLQDKAHITVAPTAEGGGMDVTSGSANYSRAERYMRFERGMHLERDGQVMEADNSTVFLRKDRDEPENVELRTNSSITGAQGTGSLQAMHANDINLRYAPDGRTLEQIYLAGQGRIQLARPDKTPGQLLEAAVIDASLAPDGMVTRLIGRDQVRVTLPANEEIAPRVITAPHLDAVGEPGRGLTVMTFDNGVEYREEGVKGNPGKVARARTLKAGMSATDNVDTAEFRGGFKFEEGRLVAESTNANYDVTKGSIELRATTGATPPHVADERVTVDATEIDMTLAPRKMTASGNVEAEFGAGRREGERGTTILDEKEPVIVRSDKFTFDEESGAGSYSGKARVFQKNGTSIRADAITLNEKIGQLRAAGNVVTVLPVAAGTGADSTGRSTGRAGEFNFDDTKRRAVYTKQAQLYGQQGDLHAQNIELFLAAGGNDLERLEARETVTVLLDKRKATGQHLTYHPNDEKYVLTGAPVQLVENCEETSGRTLTFYRGSEKIQVDGNQEIRTQAKSGKCSDTGKP